MVEKDKHRTTINRLVFRVRHIRNLFNRKWYSTCRWVTPGVGIETQWLLDIGMFTIGFAGVQTRTCHKCGSTMSKGMAYLNELQAFEDFGGESLLRTIPRGCTVSRSGKAKLVEVSKCNGCGRSITL